MVKVFGWIACLAMVPWMMGTARANEAVQTASPRMALGLIVKLKESKPQSVVRFKASALPSDGFSGQRQRIADVARRKRISYLVQRPTAYGAQVIHPGYAMPLADVEAQAQRLRADPDVEWVVVNEVVKRQAVSAPTDPGYAGQTWLQSRGGNAGVADFPAAWDFIDTWSQTHTLSPVVVAVLDTGKLDHPDMNGRWLPGYDFVYAPLAAGDGDGVDGDPTDMGDWVTSNDKLAHPDVFDSDCEVSNSSWHGLAIAGMLAANANNGQYGAGMLEQLNGPSGRALVMPVRVAGKCGAEVSSIVEGMLWATGVSYQGAPTLPPTANRARVLNLSFGGDGVCDSTSNAGPLYLQTIATLRSNGVLLVASAGNADTGAVRASLPANCPGVLAVTGLSQQGYKARYANMISDGVAVASGDVDAIHNFVDDGIYTLINTSATSADLGSYGMARKAGTSFAAPQAVGVAAMMLAINPSLSAQQLIDLIKSSAHAFPSGGPAACNPAIPQANCGCTTATCGSGVLDAGQAVSLAASTVGAGVNASATTSASYFTPSRVPSSQSTSGGGGGGGGSMDWPELLGLAGMAVLAGFKARRRPVPVRA